MPNFSQSFLSTFIPSFQRAQASRAAQSQAEFEAQQLQDRERQALVRTLLGDENVAASAKNQLLASILPQFRQQTEVTTTVPGVQATAKPVQLGRELTASAPSNLPTEADLPQSGVYNEQMGEHVNLLNRLGMSPTVQMINREAAARDKFSNRTPVGMPTTPRGSLSPEVSLRSGPDSQETKTVTTPMEVFQDKAEKKTIDPAFNDARQTVFKLYQEGKVSKPAVLEFLTSYPEAVRTGDYSKLSLPSQVEKTVSEADKTRAQSLQDRKADMMLSAISRTDNAIAQVNDDISKEFDRLNRITQQAGEPLSTTASSDFTKRINSLHNKRRELEAQKGNYIKVISGLPGYENLAPETAVNAPSRSEVVNQQEAMKVFQRLLSLGRDADYARQETTKWFNFDPMTGEKVPSSYSASAQTKTTGPQAVANQALQGTEDKASRAKALLDQAGFESDNNAVRTFLQNNPNF